MTYCFPALLFFHVALLFFVYRVQLDVAFVALAVLVAAVVAGAIRLVLDDYEGPLEGIDDAQVLQNDVDVFVVCSCSPPLVYLKDVDGPARCVFLLVAELVG